MNNQDSHYDEINELIEGSLDNLKEFLLIRGPMFKHLKDFNVRSSLD